MSDEVRGAGETLPLPACSEAIGDEVSPRPKSPGWMRDRRGEWQFDEDRTGLAIMVLPTWLIWCLASTAIVAALPLPPGAEKGATIIGIILGTVVACSVPALAFLGHRYRDEQVAAAAETLARQAC